MFSQNVFVHHRPLASTPANNPFHFICVTNTHPYRRALSYWVSPGLLNHLPSHNLPTDLLFRTTTGPDIYATTLPVPILIVSPLVLFHLHNPRAPIVSPHTPVVRIPSINLQDYLHSTITPPHLPSSHLHTSPTHLTSKAPDLLHAPNHYIAIPPPPTRS